MGVAVVVVVVVTVGVAVAVAVVVVVVQAAQLTCAANLPVDRQELVPASTFLLVVVEEVTAKEIVGGMMTVVATHCPYPPSRLLRWVQVTVTTWEVQMTTTTTSPSHPC